MLCRKKKKNSRGTYGINKRKLIWKDMLRYKFNMVHFLKFRNGKKLKIISKFQLSIKSSFDGTS